MEARDERRHREKARCARGRGRCAQGQGLPTQIDVRPHERRRVARQDESDLRTSHGFRNREMTVLDDRLVKEIALRDARAPTGRSGMIPSQPQSSPRPSAGSGTGWVAPTPLLNPPGTNWVDAIAIADD